MHIHRSKLGKANSSNYIDEIRQRTSDRHFQLGLSTGRFTEDDIYSLRSDLGDKCRYCSVDLHGAGVFQHLTPVTRGGTNSIQNVTLSCVNCDHEKANMTLEEYIEWRNNRSWSAFKN